MAAQPKKWPDQMERLYDGVPKLLRGDLALLSVARQVPRKNRHHDLEQT